MKKGLIVLAVLLLAMPCIVFSAGTKEAAPAATIIDDMEYSYEKLVELAQAEGELTIFDTSSKIVPIGEAFSKKYGITVRATKMGNPEQIERVKREVDAGNIQVESATLELVDTDGDGFADAGEGAFHTSVGDLPISARRTALPQQ